MLITDKILDCAQASSIVAGSAQVQLDRLICSVVADLGPTFAAQQITCYIQSAAYLTCYISEPHAHQIVRNLLANARDALLSTAESHPRHIYIEVAAQGERVRLQVQDNGAGMTPESQKHVFKPFYNTKGLGAQAWGWRCRARS